MLRISVLGSGSAGNSAVIFTDETRLLVDAGLSARQLNRRLELVGVDPGSLDGILITHEHVDHVCGLDVFCRSVDAPLYSNAATREVMVTGPLREPKTWRLVSTGGKFVVGDIQIQTFPVAHDATEPMGFTFRDHESAIGVLSDGGYVTNLMRNHLRDMNTLFIEANYDGVLLQNDSKRPWATKQRILSRHGHLSNDQAATLVEELVHEGLASVILGHLSQDCNEPELAVAVMRETLRRRGREEIDVCCAEQREPTPCFPAISAGRSTVCHSAKPTAAAGEGDEGANGLVSSEPSRLRASEEEETGAAVLAEGVGEAWETERDLAADRVSAGSWTRAVSFEQSELF